MSRIYSVKELNRYIKGLFQEDFLLNRVTVRGEVSNLKDHTASGHLYFTLKDDDSQISVVMFRSDRRTGEKTPLSNHMKCVVSGTVSVYEQGGSYQIYAKTVEPEGQGDLYRRFLELKERLEEEGLFSPIYKKPIPQYARTIGVVTAETGAAIHDIVHVATERNPYVQIVLCPALVQGETAVPSIVNAIRRLDKERLDVMIVGRGGGSLEDLMAFNSEEVARAIFDCDTPVISAVGHEVDVTIADFVADKRAATPSEAAEIAAFPYEIIEERFRDALKRMQNAVEQKTALLRSETSTFRAKLTAVHPGTMTRNQRLSLGYLADRLSAAVLRGLESKKQELANAGAVLHGLSPLSKLKNGYGYLSVKGSPLRSALEISAGDEVTMTVHDGRVIARAERIERIEKDGEE